VLPIGLYLHIPFCAAICGYCNFNRGLLDEALKARYVDALACDIRRAAEPHTQADTIYFGGGTPSLLHPGDVARLVEACRESFSVAADAEVTLEANPESATREQLQGFRAAGVNRLSLGVQSFRDDELTRLGRLHSADTARRAFVMARQAGFDNVSLDLMMWLPGQSVAQWLESVDALIGLGPDHASLYLLEVYPNAPLKDEMARAGWSLAPDDDAAVMYLDGLARLDAAGYVQYEISNVARPLARQARHNVKYWQGGEWLGFGCGAHSTRGGERWRTVPSVADYLARLDVGADVRLDRRRLVAEERLEEALFMGLRLTQGVDLEAVGARYGVDVWQRYGGELARYVAAGLLVHQAGRRLALTRPGMLLANEVMTVFIGGAVR
jgi:oxygen-independent coproporphyrinogen-3 oxidase